jgi:hypothetical protein
LYAKAYSNLGVLRLYDYPLISYHGDIESRMLQIRIIKDRTRNVRYDRSYTKRIRYVKKPNRRLGFFIAYDFG